MTVFNRKERNIATLISFFAITLLSIYLSISFIGFNRESTILISIVVAFFASAIFCFLVSYHFRKNNLLMELDYLNLGVQRYLLGIFMVFYGVPKLLGGFFDYQLFALDSKLYQVSEFQLAWYYFGKNKWQEVFAGIMEFVPGLLLLHRRTYYIAAIVLLPVTAQVFILNLFFKIGGITFPAACILLACNVYILYSQKEKIKIFFASLNFHPLIALGKKTQVFVKVSRYLGFTLIAAIIILKLKSSFFKNTENSNYEKLVGIYTLEEMTKNNLPYLPQKDSSYYKDIYIEKQSRWNILRRCNDETDAFMLELNTSNDSIKLFINRGGIGDSPDIIDRIGVLKATYSLTNDELIIKGIQRSDTLLLKYKKSQIKPKEWFW
jgi:hypothetical protein